MTPLLIPEPTEPETPPAPETAPPSPTDQLSKIHFTEVTVDESLSIPGGFVVAYSFSRLDAEIGELSADGLDVTEDIEAEVQACEQERAELSEEERDWLEYQDRSCEELAVAELFDDEQLFPECSTLGVAYFDLEGTLLYEEEVDGRCLDHLDRFELRDLSPLDDPDIVLVATFMVVGDLTRGGWGALESSTELHVWAPVVEDGEPVLRDLVSVDLDDDFDGGNCPYGNHRVIRRGDDGSLELYAQHWNDCADEGCLDPDTDPEEYEQEYGEPLDPDMLCRDEPVERSRAEWLADEGIWDGFYDEDWEGDGTLPPSELE